MTALSHNRQSNCQPWQDQLIGLLQRFWSLEEVPHVSRVSPEEAYCEEQYTRNHHRNENGRYVVTLPMKKDGWNLLGESLFQAQRALRSTHQRMKPDTALREQYSAFMADYLELGHMRPVTDAELGNPDHNVSYLPHHAIWRRGDGGRKLRVVFNASCPTSTGHNLNDVLCSAIKLRNDLAAVIARWRRYRIVFCADIKKMFWQILVRGNDIHLQRILWCEPGAKSVTHYALLTITYGEAAHHIWHCEPSSSSVKTKLQHSQRQKTKLSPIRSLMPSKRPSARMTIPRLELRAALLAARLLHALARSLYIRMDECHLWSDSSTVLYWLKSPDPVGNDLVDNYVHHI